MVSQNSKPAGRTLPAEQKLLDACRKGELTVISEHRPEQENEQHTVRASFLRFLALGGDERAPLHEKGLQLQGAWVDGVLDFEGAILPHSLGLYNCHLSTTPILRDSDVQGSVKFHGCHIKGLEADRMVCSGSVFLNLGFTAIGKVSLTGAQIGGDLECDDGKFDGKRDDGKGGDALTCERAVIKGSVFLRNVTATGTVRLVAAQIGGSLECHGAMLNDTGSDGALACDRAVIKGGVFLNGGFTANGTVRLMGAQIGGNLDCIDATFDGTDGGALVAEGMMVAGVFIFRDLRSVKGVVSLVSAQVSSLFDDVKSWPEGKLDLDGFVYDRLIGAAPTDAESRLVWLDKQFVSDTQIANGVKDFKPQPWRQLQKVLHDMGHAEDARQVAIAFENRLRLANLIGQTPKSWNKQIACLYRNICSLFHWLFGALIGYGYRPLRLFLIMLAVWLVCGMFYWGAALDGIFAPSNPLVFQNPDYAACVPDSEVAKLELHKSACGLPSVQGMGNWYLCKKLPEEYTGFSPLAYSLDLILPLVDLQQERDWAPMIPTPKNTWTGELLTGGLKHITRLVLWFEILFGWMASLLLVAVVSGLTKRREE